MPHDDNSWDITRKANGHTFYVTAHHIEKLDAWSMMVKTDGKLVDARQIDNPMKDCMAAIDAAIQEQCGTPVERREARKAKVITDEDA